MTALKKLIAILALTFSVTALAQEAAKPAPPPAVQVYGTFNLNLQYTEAGGAEGTAVDVEPRLAISPDSSNVGVRGTLALTDALNAVYQCETGANIDGESLVSLCNRNSRVGVSGAFGTLAYGNWDTPFKSQHYGTKADDPFGNTDVFGFQGIMGSPGYGVKTGGINVAAVPAGGSASFDLRGGNSLLYWSPKVSGLSARLQFGVDEFRSTDGVSDPMFLSAGVTFEQGPFAVFGAAEYHEDVLGIRVINAANAGATASKDLAWRVGAGYDLPLGVGTLNVMGMVEQLMYDQENSGAGYDDYSRLAWLVGAKFRTGAHELRARFTQALDPSVTTAAALAPGAADPEENLGAQQLAFGYAYHLAKSTQMYVFYTQIMNDDAARYSFGVAGAAAVTGANTPLGADPLAVGLGMRHAF
jgi:predicted porin